MFGLGVMELFVIAALIAIPLIVFIVVARLTARSVNALEKLVELQGRNTMVDAELER